MNTLRNIFVWFALFLAISLNSNAQDTINAPSHVPFSKVFYHLDKHVIGSFTYNYGLDYALAGACSYGVVKSGIDWKWYNLSNDNKWIRNSGFTSVAIGGIVPLAVPLTLYLYGRSHNNTNMQITGLAMGQSAILALAITSSIKVFTGRVPPDDLENKNDYSTHFRFGFLRGGAFDGWPSSHTAVAFAMATTLNELYPNNLTLKIGSLTYASIIGLGVSTNIHWLSDAVAGAFIGYAIGKSVGSDFRNLMGQTSKPQAYNFYVTPLGAGMVYNF